VVLAVPIAWLLVDLVSSEPEPLPPGPLDLEAFGESRALAETELQRRLEVAAESERPEREALDAWRGHFDTLTRAVKTAEPADAQRLRIARAQDTRVIRLDTRVELDAYSLEPADAVAMVDAQSSTPGRVLGGLPWLGLDPDGKPTGAPAPLAEWLQPRVIERKGPLRNAEPLALAMADVGGLAVTLTANAGCAVSIGWSLAPTPEDPDAATADASRPAEPEIALPEARDWQDLRGVGAGGRRTLRVDLIGMHRPAPVPQRLLQHVFFEPRGCPSLAIEDVRVLSRGERYAGSPVGVGYEKLGHEQRRVLYLTRPGSLAFDLEVPGDAPAFRTALASLPGTEDVRFRVEIESDAGRATLLERAAAAGVWHDVRIDLAEWAGRRVRLRLSSDTDGTPALWANPRVGPSETALPHVVWFLVDSMRADHMGLYGYPLDTTPALDAFFGQGVVFEQAFTNGNDTRSATSTLFTGLTSTALGTHQPGGRVDDVQLTFHEVLRELGYRTIGLVANGNAGAAAGLGQGYSELLGQDWIAAQSGGEAWDGKPRFTPEVLHALRERLGQTSSEPVFLYVHTLDTHAPYEPPPGYAERFEPARYADHAKRWGLSAERVSEVRRYDGELRYTDDLFAGLQEILTAAGILPDAIVWLLSDHGEFLGEGGMWGHDPWFAPLDPLLNVPLALVVPERWKAHRVTAPVQLLDVGETTLALLGHSEARRPWSLGRDLSTLLDGGAAPPLRPLISENHSVRSENVTTAARIGPAVYRQARHREWVDEVPASVDLPDRGEFRDTLRAYRRLTDAFREKTLAQTAVAAAPNDVAQLEELERDGERAGRSDR
jgi:arylsulfatase A-like enzyme